MKKIRIPRKLKKNKYFYNSLNYIFPYVPKLLRYYSYMSIEYGIKTYNMTPEQLYDTFGRYTLDDVVWWYWVRCKHGMEELPKRKDVKEYLQYFNDKGVINNKKSQ
jgi:hypothetical protein